MTKKTTISLILGLLVLGLIVYGLQQRGIIRLFNTSSETTDPAIMEAETKKAQLTQNEEGSKDNGSGTYTPPQDSSGIELSPSQSGDSVVVTTKLKGYSDGTCKLTATNGASKTEQSAPVMFGREFSTCAGFSVPVSSLGKGTWSLLLEVTSGGVTNSKSGSLEVT